VLLSFFSLLFVYQSSLGEVDLDFTSSRMDWRMIRLALLVCLVILVLEYPYLFFSLLKTSC